MSENLEYNPEKKYLIFSIKDFPEKVQSHLISTLDVNGFIVNEKKFRQILIDNASNLGFPVEEIIPLLSGGLILNIYRDAERPQLGLNFKNNSYKFTAETLPGRIESCKVQTLAVIGVNNDQLILGYLNDKGDYHYAGRVPFLKREDLFPSGEESIVPKKDDVNWINPRKLKKVVKVKNTGLSAGVYPVFSFKDDEIIEVGKDFSALMRDPQIVEIIEIEPTPEQLGLSQIPQLRNQRDYHKRLAIDFDNTIVEHSEAKNIDIGDPLPGAIEALKKLKAEGYELVIFSCRGNNQLGVAELAQWFESHSCPYDEIWMGKPEVEFFIDDRAIGFNGSWDAILDEIAGRKAIRESRLTQAYKYIDQSKIKEYLKGLDEVSKLLKMYDQDISFLNTILFEPGEEWEYNYHGHILTYNSDKAFDVKEIPSWIHELDHALRYSLAPKDVIERPEEVAEWEEYFPSYLSQPTEMQATVSNVKILIDKGLSKAEIIETLRKAEPTWEVAEIEMAYQIAKKIGDRSLITSPISAIDLESSEPGSKDFKFSSVQVAAPKEIADKILAWSKKNIPEDILFRNDDAHGREDYPHITVLYGIHSPKADEAVNLLEGNRKVHIELGKISLFENEDKPYDVVKIDIKSDDLGRLHKKILDGIKVTETHPEYHPHMTLAYVKKGKGAPYVGDTYFEGTSFDVNELEFSSKDKELGATPIGLSAADSASRAAHMRRAQLWKAMQTMDKNDPAYQDLKIEYDSLADLAKAYDLVPSYASKKEGAFLPSLPGVVWDYKDPSTNSLQPGSPLESLHPVNQNNTYDYFSLLHDKKDPKNMLNLLINIDKSKDKSKKKPISKDEIDVEADGWKNLAPAVILPFISPADMPQKEIAPIEQKLPIGWNNYTHLIEAAAAAHGVPLDILTRLLKTENAPGNPVAVNPSSGATGLAQFMPSTAEYLGVDPKDPASSIDGAAKYLKRLHKQFGNWEDAVKAYNWGPGNVAKALERGDEALPAETREYLKKVLPERESHLTMIAAADRFSEIIKKIQASAEKLGLKAYAVGGFVRDEIIGRNPKDLDVMVEGENGGIRLAQQMARDYNLHEPVIFPRFGTAQLTIDGEEIEFVAPRKEYYTEESRKPTTEIGSLEQDALRRDFSINALFKDLKTGNILDLTGHGLQDIKNKVIRVTDPENADVIFSQDPLRMLRAIRQSLALGFTIDESTLDAIKRNVERLNIISKERIRDEFSKIITGPNASEGIRLLHKLGLTKQFLPEWDAVVGVSQETEFHDSTVDQHILKVFDNVPADVKARLAALFHDISKPAAKTIVDEVAHFYRHEEMGAEVVGEALKRLKFPNDIIEPVKAAVGEHMRPHHYTKSWADKTIRKLMRDLGPHLELVLQLAEADIKGGSPKRQDERLQNLDDLKRRIKEQEASPAPPQPAKPLIDGNELQQMFSRGPGRWIKDVQEHLVDKQDENPGRVLTKEELTQFAKDFMQTYKASSLISEAEYFRFDPNSTKNEGRWRLQDPAKFDADSFIRWKTWGGVDAPSGVTFIVGEVKGHKTLQAIRFDKNLFDEDSAREFWNSIKHKAGFTRDWSWKDVKSHLYAEADDASSVVEGYDILNSDIPAKEKIKKLVAIKEYSMALRLLKQEKIKAPKLQEQLESLTSDNKIKGLDDAKRLLQKGDTSGKKQALEWLAKQKDYNAIYEGTIDLDNFGVVSSAIDLLQEGNDLIDIKKYFNKHTNPSIRAYAFRSLVNMKEATPDHINKALKDDDLKVRKEAYSYLLDIDDVDTIYKNILNEPSEEQRLRIYQIVLNHFILSASKLPWVNKFIQLIPQDPSGTVQQFFTEWVKSEKKRQEENKKQEAEEVELRKKVQEEIDKFPPKAEEKPKETPKVENPRKKALERKKKRELLTERLNFYQERLNTQTEQVKHLDNLIGNYESTLPKIPTKEEAVYDLRKKFNWLSEKDINEKAEELIKSETEGRKNNKTLQSLVKQRDDFAKEIPRLQEAFKEFTKELEKMKEYLATPEGQKQQKEDDALIAEINEEQEAARKAEEAYQNKKWPPLTPEQIKDMQGFLDFMRDKFEEEFKQPAEGKDFFDWHSRNELKLKKEWRESHPAPAKAISSLEVDAVQPPTTWPTHGPWNYAPALPLVRDEDLLAPDVRQYYGRPQTKFRNLLNLILDFIKKPLSKDEVKEEEENRPDETK